jgi:hypothetical protein
MLGSIVQCRELKLSKVSLTSATRSGLSRGLVEVWRAERNLETRKNFETDFSNGKC